MRQERCEYMEQIIAIVIGSLFIAGLAASLAFLYKDKPMQSSPCRTCTADCPSKKLSPEEQKEYYKKELEKIKASKCGETRKDKEDV